MLEINNLTRIKFSCSTIKKLFLKINKILKIKKDISLAFINSEQIKKLNKIYRQKNKITDALAFTGDDKFLGEIIISLPQALKQARQAKHSLTKEVGTLFIHGLLHLLGFDHQRKKEQIKMAEMEKKLLRYM